MTKAAKIIDIASGNLPAVIDLDVTNKLLAELKTKYETLPEDLSNKDNYDFVQKGINELRSYRPKVKAKGKELKDSANEWIRKVTAEEKRIDGAICEILDPMATHKKLYDDKVAAEKEAKRKAEQARKDAHLAGINGIRMLVAQAQGMNSEQLENWITRLDDVKPGEEYEEFQAEAQAVWDDTEYALQSLLIKVQTQEEADRKRAVEDARLKAEREQLERDRAELAAMQAKAIEIANQDSSPVFSCDKEPINEQVVKSVTPELSSSVASPAVQQAVKEDESVISKMRSETMKAILLVVSNHDSDDYNNCERIAEALLNAIYQGRIPNVRFDM